MPRLLKWSCRDSNPGPDKEAVVLSTCVSMLGLSGNPGRTSGLWCSLIGSWVSPANHRSLQTIFYLRRSELPGVKAYPGGTMALPNSKLGSHGVRIVAGCCLVDFLTGDSTTSRHAYPRHAQAVNSGQPQMRKNKFRRVYPSGPRRYAGFRKRKRRPECFPGIPHFRLRPGRVMR